MFVSFNDSLEMLEYPEMPCRRWRSLSPDMYEPDVTLTPETSRPCGMRHCRSRIPLAEVYRWKTCTGCRAHARREARRKRDARAEAQHSPRPPEVIPRFPAYQNRGTLVSSFDAQLRGFIEGQLMYLRAKLRERGYEGGLGTQAENASRIFLQVPMVFVFVGEYSIVTGQRGTVDGENDEGNSHACDRDCDASPSPEAEAEAELEAMRREVSGVMLELERALRTKFR